MNYQTLNAKTLNDLAVEYKRFVWNAIGDGKAFVHLEADEGFCYATIAPLWEDKVRSVINSQYYHLYLRQTPFGVKRVFSAEPLYETNLVPVMGVWCLESTSDYLFQSTLPVGGATSTFSTFPLITIEPSFVSILMFPSIPDAISMLR